VAPPDALVQMSQGWARIYADSKAVSIAVTFCHLAGLLLGGGAAVAADRETLKAARESDPIRADHLAFLGTVHGIAIAGLIVLAASGAAMLLADLANFWSARSFWIKMGLVATLLANGLLMRRAERTAPSRPGAAWRQLTLTSIASLALWFAIVLTSVVLASS
jgi:hypothetical protein